MTTAATIVALLEDADATFDMIAPMLGVGEFATIADAATKFAQKALAASQAAAPVAAAEIAAADAAATAAETAKFSGPGGVK